MTADARSGRGAPALGLTLAWLGALGVTAGCGGCPAEQPQPDAGADAPLADVDAGSDADTEVPDAGLADAGDDAEAGAEALGCPFDMVRVARRFCVDRYEATLVDDVTGRGLSPFYPPSRKKAVGIERAWQSLRLESGDADAQAMPLPELPGWQRTAEIAPRAVSRRGVVPHGYLSGEMAAAACTNARKRLCREDEWRTACRGEQDRQFPYGAEHVQGRCNMFREGHPAAILHGNAAEGHLDPRLNQVKVAGKPLLRKTGDTPACKSEWEGDAIYDMVGNLDEWIDDPEGTFLGGFYARSKKDGCDSTVRFHTFDYLDYSLGVRCCSDLMAVEPVR